MDAGYVRQVRCGERSSGGLDDGAFLDAREGQREHCESDPASLDDRVGGMVAQHAWSDYGAGGVLRREGAKGFCEISREAEGSNRHLPGAGEPFSAEAGRSARATEPADAAASAANWRTACRGSICSLSEDREGADGILEAGRCGGGAARFEQTTRTAEHDRCKPGALRHWADPDGVHYRRGISRD